MQLREQIRLRKALEAEFPQSEVSLHYNLLYENGKYSLAHYVVVKDGTNSVSVGFGDDESLDAIVNRVRTAPTNVNAAWEVERGANGSGRI